MAYQAQPSSREDLNDYDIRLIVAGSRGYNDYRFFEKMMDDFIASEFIGKSIIFISGKARTGPDAMIIRYCKERRLPWVEYEADWDNLDTEGAVIRTNKRTGKPYNAIAGHTRNEDMAKVATNLAAFWDGVSPGTKNMLHIAKRHKVRRSIFLVELDKE